MRDGNERLDSVCAATAKHILIESETLLIGRLLIAVREDAGPRDREAEDLEAHLGEQLDILAIMMVEIDARLSRIVVPGLKIEHAAQTATHIVSL